MVNLKLNVPLGTFFQSTSVALFQDKLAGLLGLSPDRIRIAGVWSGSTVVHFFIGPSGDITPNTTASSDELIEVMNRLRQKALSGTLNVGFEVLSIETTVSLNNPNS